MFDIDFEASFDFCTQQSMLPIAARSYISMISDHYMSEDRFSLPYKYYELPQVEKPHTQFSSHAYFEMTGFWPEQLVEINQELTQIQVLFNVEELVALPLKIWQYFCS